MGTKKSSTMKIQVPKTLNLTLSRKTKYFPKLPMTHGCEPRTGTKKKIQIKTKKRHSSHVFYSTVNKEL